MEDALNPKTDEQIEADIQAKGLTAPRLTSELIQLAIADEVFTHLEGTHSIVCALTLANGHKVIGVAEGPVSAANFDLQVGCDVAYKKAVDQVWALEGYLLRQRLFDLAENPPHEGATHVANPIYITARQIEAVARNAPANGYTLKLFEGGRYEADAGQVARYTPVPGDYLVTQSDGYVYIAPREVFERKYRKF